MGQLKNEVFQENSIRKDNKSIDPAFAMEVIARFGILPNFFQSGTAAPGLMQELWKFTHSAYFNNPLPTLFKERLLVYLSRFCPIRYCVIRHTGFLLGYGHAAGDSNVKPQSLEDVLALLKIPPPDFALTESLFKRLNHSEFPAQLPIPGSKEESDLFTALAIIFLEPGAAERSRDFVQSKMGQMLFELLIAFLAFVRMLHYWTETHPEIDIDDDMIELLRKEPVLAEMLQDKAEAERVQSASMLRQQLYQSQQRFSKLFNAIETGYFIGELVIDYSGKAKDFVFLETNEAFKLQNGGAEIAGLLHSGVISIIEATMIESFAHVVSTGQSMKAEIQDMVSGQWYSYSIVPYPDLIPNRFAVSSSNITYQKEIEKELEARVKERTNELERMNKELLRSNADLEDFAHAVSHDLREPVRKVRVFTQLLQEQVADRLTTGENELVHRIDRAASWMSGLIEDLLVFSHVSDHPVEMCQVDLNKVLDDVVENIGLELNGSKTIIESKDLPVVKGYERQMRQLFQNLIGNSIKYRRTDVSPRIEISSSVVKKNEEEYYQILFADNGIGFDQQYANQIFQVFARLHLKQEYSGAGIGLSIVKKVVNNHKGYIKVESAPNLGAKFYIYLPASR